MQHKLNFEFSVFDRTSQKLSHAFQKGSKEMTMFLVVSEYTKNAKIHTTLTHMQVEQHYYHRKESLLLT